MSDVVRCVNERMQRLGRREKNHTHTHDNFQNGGFHMSSWFSEETNWDGGGRRARARGGRGKGRRGRTHHLDRQTLEHEQGTAVYRKIYMNESIRQRQPQRQDSRQIRSRIALNHGSKNASLLELPCHSSFSRHNEQRARAEKLWGPLYFQDEKGRCWTFLSRPRSARTWRLKRESKRIVVWISRGFSSSRYRL